MQHEAKQRGIRSATRGQKTQRALNQFALQSMMLPALITVFVFCYIPMYGLIIAFKDANNILIPIHQAPWVGGKFFLEFLSDPFLKQTLINTLSLNGLALLLSFPAPILLALMIHEVRFAPYKRFVQTASYLPYFLSWVIFGGIVVDLLTPGGLVSAVATQLTNARAPMNIMGDANSFYGMYTVVNMIKNVGYASIFYLAAIAGVDQEMYEAAVVDGCNRLQKTLYITLPAISSTIAILLILQISAILNTGIEQVLILQNNANLLYSETIDTYVYKVGISQGRQSYATAVGLLKSVISIVLLVSANFITRRTMDRSLF